MGLSPTAIFIKSRVDVLMRTDHSVVYVDKSEPEIVLKAETIWIDGKPYGPPSMVEETSNDLTREHDVYEAISPHRYITKCFGITHDDDGHAIALKLERATKGNLRHIIEEAPEPPSIDRRLEMATIIAESIAHLHSRGVIWGDISTRNILVFSDDTLKICDFASSALSQTYPEFGPHTSRKASAKGIIGCRQQQGSKNDNFGHDLINDHLNPHKLHVATTVPIMIDIFRLPFSELHARAFESLKEIHTFQDITKVSLYLASINICKLVEVDSKCVIADPPEPELQFIAIFTVIEEL
ncbi:TKL kinase [Fusarium mundagurra]|uniref:TKL kinase n=1 Tax=Fusarium mundagurra TaxID=1567541 RepID=A0A8H5Z6E2_9HYPO|nr:TKL kinase [Fusarium mundagurra]